jgi:hypothetical protein
MQSMTLMRSGYSSCLVLLSAGVCVAQAWAAEFIDEFDQRDPAAAGWTTATGDGDARIRFSSAGGTAYIDVDAREDVRNIWWAFIRHPVTPAIDEAELARPDRELRIEARVRTDTAPRRINLHANHTRTTDFHSHLREYDLPATKEWFDISMTTRDFDARADDEVFVQLALMDWGRRTYRLEIDYIRVRVVDPAEAGPDLGRPLPYRPNVPAPVSYPHAVPITAAATVDRAAPQTAGAWRSPDNGESAGQLVAGPSQVIVLRWDFAGIGARTAPGWGVLALYTASVLERRADLESFTELRVAEILAGDRSWTAADVKWDSFLGGRPEWAVINEQPMIDVRPAAAGTRTLIPVSPPVLERLLDGRSKGLAISSHGGVVASFAAGDDAPPTLYFDATPGTTTQTQEGHPEND